MSSGCNKALLVDDYNGDLNTIYRCLIITNMGIGLDLINDDGLMFFFVRDYATHQKMGIIKKGLLNTAQAMSTPAL